MKNIKNIDLNLLLVFSALCRERNTTRTAEVLGLSQPAISHALARLREQFGDPLFVRASRGLVPTAYALELEGPVRSILQQIEQVISTPNVFDPAKATNTFRIATTDYFEQVVFPSLLKRVEKEAPHITLISRPTSGELPKMELESGSYDLAIAGFYSQLPENFLKQKLFEDIFTCVARKGHPRINKKKLSLEHYANEKHLLISVHGDMKAKTQNILASKGLQQHFTSGVASFLSPGWIIAETDLLLTCPTQLAQSYEKYLPINLYDIPFEMPKIQVVQVWHERSHKESAHTWLRKLIWEVCSEL